MPQIFSSPSTARQPRLLDQVRAVIWTLHHDFDYGQITVRDSKGNKDRVTMLPDRLKEPLRRHLEKVRKLHEQDLRDGCGEISCLTR